MRWTIGRAAIIDDGRRRSALVSFSISSLDFVSLVYFVIIDLIFISTSLSMKSKSDSTRRHTLLDCGPEVLSAV